MLKSKENYKDGKKEGEWLLYFENGKLYKTEIYKDDKLIEKIAAAEEKIKVLQQFKL